MATKRKTLCPDFIFESSWEVCNKVGGIYTVLSTRAKTLQQEMQDKLIFIGPDFWQNKKNPLFSEEKQLFKEWAAEAGKEGLKVRTGRWNIPGNPCVILVDFKPFFDIKNELYGAAWMDFQVDSLNAYGDYDEASMFSYAAARVIESFYGYYLQGTKNVVYQAHEWMTGLGALYLRKHVPEIATIFTTHATTVGRSIAGNGKPLYDYLWAYNGTQMSHELNVAAKHSVERQTAHNVDCFTTVSDVTAKECAELLDRPCDEVLMNGFEADFVPAGADFEKVRKEARARIFRVANALTGCTFADDTLVVATSGRYEIKNKGIDVFVDAMNRLRHMLNAEGEGRQVLALVEVPAWSGEAREDLKARLKGRAKVYDTALECPVITHELHNFDEDNVMGQLRYFDFWNGADDRVKIIFVPCYLDGSDGVFNRHYYDMLIGNDLSVYPSYYEPWGYTPLESVAFHVPCVTTSLSGFGMWANAVKGERSEITDGVEVVTRTDYNYSEVADTIAATVKRYMTLADKEVAAARKAAQKLSEKALWKHFIKYYHKAYDIALRKAQERTNK